MYKSVLHIGIQAPSHSPKGMEKGFRGSGFIEYHFFDWQAVRFNEGILGCQGRMIAAAKQIMPDLIFCQFQNDSICDEETAIELSKCGFTVNFTFDVRGPEQTEWYYDVATHFGLTLFACHEDVEEAKRRGINTVGHLHSSCDTDQYRPIVLPDDIKYPEIVFIGNNYANTNLEFEQAQERVGMVNFMKAEFGDRFGVYGIAWEPGSKMVNPIEEVNIYNGCKIAITHNNYKRNGYCSDRQWRAMACGTLTIPQYYTGLKEDFSFKPMPYWETLWELKNICNNYLNEPVFHGMINKISLLQESNFLDNHTWKHRFETMLSMINSIKNGTGN